MYSFGIGSESGPSSVDGSNREEEEDGWTGAEGDADDKDDERGATDIADRTGVVGAEMV